MIGPALGSLMWHRLTRERVAEGSRMRWGEWSANCSPGSMGRVRSRSVGALAVILLGEGCGRSITHPQPSATGVAGRPEATGGLGGDALPTDGADTGAGGATDAGSASGSAGAVSVGGGGGVPPRVGCESNQCRNGHIIFGSGCPGPYTKCDPATNDGVECVPTGPCPSDVVDVAPCVEDQTSADPLNCGACGAVCAPSVLMTDPAFISGRVAADATSVYFTSGIDDWIRKVAATGGSPITLFSGSGNSYSQAIAVGSTHVYWSSFDRQTGQSSVLAVSVDGGEPTTIVSGQTSMTAIAVDSTNLYWLGTLDGKVMKAPLAGGEPTTLATEGLLESLAVDATNVYYTTGDLENTTNGSVTRGSVMKVPIDGNTPMRLAEGPFPGESGTLAVDDNNVYFVAVVDGANDQVLSVPKTGGPVTTLASGVTLPVGLAADATGVYWTSSRPSEASGALAMVPLTGGPVVTLAARLGHPRSVALGGTSVFWAQDYGEAKLMRIPKNPCRDGACVE